MKYSDYWTSWLAHSVSYRYTTPINYSHWYYKSNYSHSLVRSFLWAIAGQTHRWYHWHSFFVSFILSKTSWFHMAVHLFSNSSQKTSQCGKNSSHTCAYHLCVTYFCPYYILMSSEIDHLAGKWQMQSICLIYTQVYKKTEVLIVTLHVTLSAKQWLL